MNKNNFNLFNNILTKRECLSLRGIAILGIILHNYCHWLKFAVKENEFTFTRQNAIHMFEVTMNLDANFLIHFFSFFGHYGVSIFVFLSAFGLAMKYENKLQVFSNIAFIHQHFIKLFQLLLIGFIIFITIDTISKSGHQYHLKNVIFLFGMLINLFPDPNKIIFPGPYWFFGMIMQLYIIYSLFLYRSSIITIIIWILFCLLIQFYFSESRKIINWIHYNFIGNFLPFGLGLIYARYKININPSYYVIILLTSILFVILGNFYFSTWLFLPIFFIFLSSCFVRYCSNKIHSILEWIGNISASLFIIHPIIRQVFLPISRKGDVYTGLTFYILSSLFFAWMLKYLLNEIQSKKLQ